MDAFPEREFLKEKSVSATDGEMVWSVDTVARETQDRIRRLGRTLQIFTPLHDIDVPADLPYLPTNWNEIVREIV